MDMTRNDDSSFSLILGSMEFCHAYWHEANLHIRYVEINWFIPYTNEAKTDEQATTGDWHQKPWTADKITSFTLCDNVVGNNVKHISVKEPGRHDSFH